MAAAPNATTVSAVRPLETPPPLQPQGAVVTPVVQSSAAVRASLLAAASVATAVAAAAPAKGRRRGRKQPPPLSTPGVVLARMTAEQHRLQSEHDAAQASMLDKANRYMAAVVAALAQRLRANSSSSSDSAGAGTATTAAQRRAATAAELSLVQRDSGVPSPLCQWGALALATQRHLRPGTAPMFTAARALLAQAVQWLEQPAQRALVESHERLGADDAPLTPDAWLAQLRAGAIMGDSLTLMAYATLNRTRVRLLTGLPSDPVLFVDPQQLPDDVPLDSLPTVTIAIDLVGRHYVACVSTYWKREVVRGTNSNLFLPCRGVGVACYAAAQPRRHVTSAVRRTTN